MILHGRTIYPGPATGEALVTSQNISFFGGVDPETGMVVERGHELEGQSVAGRVLVFPTGKGSTVGSYTLYRLKAAGRAPAAILNAECETITAVGCIIAEIPCLDQLPIEELKTGLLLRIDAFTGQVEILEESPSSSVTIIPRRIFNMNCPKDSTPLETHELLGVQVDECPTCRGFFFDHGELEKAKNAADPDLRWMDVELWKDEDSYSVALSQWACPRDGQPMVAIAYEETGVVIDHCLKCKGVWLDGGKFAQLITALEKELLSKPGDEYFKESLVEAGELVTGDKGFASEWRDFLTVARLMQYRVLSENPKLAQALTAFARAVPFK